ncbi:MAG: ABC transporter permease [Pseudomonadota bacterium]
MNAVLSGLSSVAESSPGLWRLAGRRLLKDRVGVVSAIIVAFFLLLMIASATGLIAADWNKEVGVSYANPSFLAGQENLEAKKHKATTEKTDIPPADLSDVDPLAPWYGEWEKRTKEIKVSEPQQAEALPFGGDKWGRDIVKKTIKGAQSSIVVGLVSAFIAVFLGTLFGAVAGYFGKWVGDFFEWFYNVFTSIPYILLILAFAAVFGSSPFLAQFRGMPMVILILSLTGWTGIYRLVRAEYMKHRSREYVRAAEAIGASDQRRMFVHILPNVSHVVLVQLSQHVVGFIKAEVILSFLGFGVPIESVSWGTMLAEAQNELVIGKWWQLVAAGASMALLVTAFSMFTDALRDALDPKLK